jgi:hypothetical protein
MIEIKVEILKDIPEKQIKTYEDRVVYNCASITREYVKGSNAYPYLTGELARQEIASSITGGNAEYNLLAGVNYAKYVWKMSNVKWTNSSTEPQWYFNMYRKYGQTIQTTASDKALKEIE